MKISMQIGYAGGFADSVAQVQALEKAGLDIAYVAEAYGYDGVSLMGYLAAVTETVQIAAGILPIYTRTPSLLAMTAAGVDEVSGGRCILGLGASGPQVIEGFHGVAYDAPIQRTREIVEICRQIWRREAPVVHDGKRYQLPLPADKGTGLGKPLKMITHPIRSDIPIHIAALGPKNVQLTAEIAQGWLPILYHPGRAEEIWGADLAAGYALRDPALGPMDVVAGGMLAIGPESEVGAYRDFGRAMVALYVGGMGARGKNFYNSLFQRYGYEAEAAQIQDLYLSGNKKDATAAVPSEFLEKTSLCGDEAYLKDRIAEYKASGVTVLNVTPIAPDLEAQQRLVAKVKELAS